MRVLMFGFSPLPVENLRMTGPSLRTWHFLNVVLASGHEVCLVGYRPHSGVYPSDLPDIVSQRKGDLLYHNLANRAWFSPKAVRPLVDQWRGDCVVGVTTAGAAAAADYADSLPLWADLYGSIMAEAQVKALVYGDDSYLAHFWEMERKVLERADLISAVSERQKWAVVGELGMWGRLNQWTSGYDFVKVIPVASETTPYARRAPFVRGKWVDENAFIVLYTGGYNTWTDVETLFKALECVMAVRPEVVFVSTGGQIEGHDDMTYARFQSMIRQSAFRDRYKLLGWLSSEALQSCYLESNVGVITDRASYEALLGSRTRVLDWMRAGLPCILSSLTELAQAVVEADAGMAYPPANVDELAHCLLRCAEQRSATAAMGQRARQLLLERYSFEMTTQALQAWVGQPTHAPDYGRNVQKLVAPHRAGGGQGLKSLAQTGFLLGLSMRLWPIFVSATNALGLSRMQAWVVELSRRLLLLSRSSYRAAYLSYQLPTQMQVGEVYRGNVKLLNTSSLAWLTSKQTPNPVCVSYRWIREDGEVLVWEGARSSLETVVERGQTATVPVLISAPKKAGRYVLQLDLVRENVAWFSEQGSPGPSALVEVVEGLGVAKRPPDSDEPGLGLEVRPIHQQAAQQ